MQFSPVALLMNALQMFCSEQSARCMVWLEAQTDGLVATKVVSAHSTSPLVASDAHAMCCFAYTRCFYTRKAA